MNVVVCSVWRNERVIAPFFIRHYSKVASRIIIYDDASDDGTVEYLSSNPIVEVRPWPFRSGLDDPGMLHCAERTNAELAGTFDGWICWPDADEFVVGDWRSLDSMNDQCSVIRCDGVNMVGDGLPVDDGTSQIWELCNIGVPAPIYSKPILYKNGFNPSWHMGKHALNDGANRMCENMGFSLLHYRYMGFEYSKYRNDRNWNRVLEKAYAWSCDPNYSGPHSAQWAQTVKEDGRPVTINNVV
jgi:glycosyl transferase family 2